MGNQGFRRTRKLCRAQQRSITRSRTPAFHKRIRSLTMRHRLTLLLTCSMRSRRWLSAWFARCCSRVSSWPRGFLVGMRIVTSGSANARKPRSCKSRLPAGKGYGVVSTMGLSWVRPPWVSLRKRMTRRAFEFISITSLAAKGEDAPGSMQGTADVPHPIATTHLPLAAAVFDTATALDTALDMVDPQPTLVELLVSQVLLPREF